MCEILKYYIFLCFNCFFNLL